jgi:hypothetical protein
MDKKLEDFMKAQEEKFNQSEMGKNKIAVNKLIEKFMQDCKKEKQNA